MAHHWNALVKLYGDIAVELLLQDNVGEQLRGAAVTIQESMNKAKSANPDSKIWVPGIANIVTDLMNEGARSKYTDYINAEMLENLPKADARYATLATSAQATAQLRLAFQAANSVQGNDQHANPAIKAWAENAERSTGIHLTDLAQLNLPEIAQSDAPLGSKQAQYAREEISGADKEKQLVARHQLTDQLGHILTALIIHHPELLKNQKVQNAVNAMETLVDVQLNETANAYQALGKPDDKIFKADMQTVLRDHITDKEKFSANPEKGFFQRLFDTIRNTLKSVVSKVKNLYHRITRQDDKITDDSTQPADSIIIGTIEALHELAPGQHNQNNAKSLSPELLNALYDFIEGNAKAMGSEVVDNKLLEMISTQRQQDGISPQS